MRSCFLNRFGHWRITLLAIVTIVLASATSARAGDQSRFADNLLGDWGGLRGDLLDNGIDLTIDYESESASNVQGGKKLGVRYTDQLTFGTRLDLDRLLGLDQAQLQLTITDRNGRNLSSDLHLDTLQLVQEVFGRGQTWRITQLWYHQIYFGGALDWKAGRLTVGEDFASFFCEFMNLTFCGAPPGNLVGNYWYNWPVSQWAMRLKANLTDFGYAQLGAYEVNPNWLTRRYAFYLWDPPDATGALIPAELGWFPSVGAAQLPGGYKFGAWYNTSRTPDVVLNAQSKLLGLAGGQPLQRNGAYGVYVNFIQQLTEGAPATGRGVNVFLNVSEPAEGLNAFFNATFADRQTATLDSQIAVGLVRVGPFASRPADQVAIAIGRTHVNKRVAGAEGLQNAAGLGPIGVQHSEYVGEIYYKLHAAPGIYLQPNIQYIVSPGGVSGNANDLILGFKLVVHL
jgi:porin